MRAPYFAMLSSPLLLLIVTALGCGGSNQPAPTTPAASAATASGDPTITHPDHPDSAKVTWKKDAPAKSCHTGDKGAGDLSASVTKIATSCVDTKAMRQVGTTTTGTGSSTAMVTAIPLKAQANHCYRFFGLAEATVTDFDIAVIDSAGKSCGEDLNDNNDAIVLEDGNICFTVDDNVNVNAAVASGTGKWAVEIWSD
jgi:hypothetical protein